MPLSKEQIAQRIARELKHGYYVNLGIGIPTLVANYIPSGVDVVLQSESPIAAPQLHETAVNNQGVNNDGEHRPQQGYAHNDALDRPWQIGVHTTVPFSIDGDVSLFTQPDALQHERADRE